MDDSIPSELDLLLSEAAYSVNLSRAERAIAVQVREDFARSNNTHHTAAGWSNGRPVVKPIGGEPYPAIGSMVTNASVSRRTPLLYMASSARLGQMTRRREVVEDPRNPTAEIAFLYLFHDVGGSEYIDVQRFYVGGICPMVLVNEINRIEPPVTGFLRRRSVASALALESRGAVLEIRKGRLFPYALDAGETPPADYEDQMYVNPYSDYYKFDNRQAFLIDRSGTVSEIEPGNNEHIGSWTHDLKGFYLLNQFDLGDQVNYCRDINLSPGGGLVNNDSNRHDGLITILQPTEPAIGASVPLVNYASLDARERLMLGSELEMPIWLCSAELQSLEGQCRAVIQQYEAVVLTGIDVNIEGTEEGYLLQLSGLYIP